MISGLLKSKVKGALIAAAIVFSGSYHAQLNLKWSEMGPNDIAGRSRSIIIDNQDPSGKTIYAAGVSGGIFKTTNSAANWAPVNDQALTPMISCMTQAADGAIFLGTGETFGKRVNRGDGYSGFLGTGLYKLVGATMTLVKDSVFFGNINEVAADKTNAQRIYVAAEKGFFVSTDGGANFTAIPTSTNTAISAMDVKVTADNSVLFSVGTKTGTTSRVYRSLTGLSGSYTDVTPDGVNSDAVSQATANCGRIEIATAPSNANVLYLSIAKPTGMLNALYISNDKGTTWKIITLGTTQNDPLTLLGNYAHTIAVDPSNSGVLYIAALEFFTWTQISSSAPGQGIWSQNYQLFIPIHDMKCSGTNMYVATDAGVYKSIPTSSSFGFIPYLSFTNSYNAFIAYNKGFNISQFNSVAFQNKPRNTSTTNTAVPVAGAAGGTSGTGLAYLPGYLNDFQTSLTYEYGTFNYQSEFSKIIPNALFISGGVGSMRRSADITITSPSNFSDQQFKGNLGSIEENTPMRLFENYGQMPPSDFETFYNPIVKTTFKTVNATATSFTVTNSRPQESAKYDWIYVNATSTKKLGQPQSVTYTVANTNSSTATFTMTTVRANNLSKYNTLVASFVSNKLGLGNVPSQSFTITCGYTGTVVTSYTSTGTSTVNMVTVSPTLTDNVVFTFNSAPNDSSIITLVVKPRYAQDLSYQPVYTGSVITSYNVFGEANTTFSTNNVVFLENNRLNSSNQPNPYYLKDSIRYKFAIAPGYDSVTITTNIHLKYDVGAKIRIDNADISGQFFADSIYLTSPLFTFSNPNFIRIPLKKSARLAVGTNGSVFAVKRPLTFSKSPDWIKIAGTRSREDSPGGVATSTDVVTAVSGVVQRLEWAPDGKSIYFSTSSAGGTNIYRISHIDFIGDSVDYTGAFTTDIDSAFQARRAVTYRTTQLGRILAPITSISVKSDNSGIMFTVGSYSNTVGTVYTSNGDIRTANKNTVDASNFSIKNGTGLPMMPAYSCLLEMKDNKRALVGTEYGMYSTSDITVASPIWAKEVGPVGNQIPNVPIFQIRQQTMASWDCYNSGIIYVATHGRGLWSTDNYATPYAIGISEQEKETLTANSGIKLYPNPANENSNVWFNNNNDATSFNVTVLDISGRVVMKLSTDKLQAGEHTMQLNTANLISGVYFVNVSSSNNFNATTKLVIAK